MNFNEYQMAAMRTAKAEAEPLTGNLVHASLGLATETGEFTSSVKRMARYGKEMTSEMEGHLLEELGDTLWYIALAIEALGKKMEDVADNNIAKLRIRFPDAYSNEAAESRADKGGLDHRSS